MHFHQFALSGLLLPQRCDMRKCHLTNFSETFSSTTTQQQQQHKKTTTTTTQQQQQQQQPLVLLWCFCCCVVVVVVLLLLYVKSPAGATTAPSYTPTFVQI